MYLIEEYIWKERWINELPSRRYFVHSKEDCISYLIKQQKENFQYLPEFDNEDFSLEWSDGRRNYLIQCFELESLPNN